jgi:hypothetical protein
VRLTDLAKKMVSMEFSCDKTTYTMHNSLSQESEGIIYTLGDFSS